MGKRRKNKAKCMLNCLIMNNAPKASIHKWLNIYKKEKLLLSELEASGNDIKPFTESPLLMNRIDFCNAPQGSTIATALKNLKDLGDKNTSIQDDAVYIQQVYCGQIPSTNEPAFQPGKMSSMKCSSSCVKKASEVLHSKKNS